MQFEIRHIVPEDFPSIIADLADMQDIEPADRDLALRVLDWWFFQNPWGNGIYAGAFSGSKLAGVASLTPKRFMLRGQPLMGAEIGRTMTHADFRGQGIFSLLVKHLIDAAREREYAAIFGTPNQASGRIYRGRLDFKDIFTSDRFARPLNWRRLGSRAGRLGEWAAAATGFGFDQLFRLKVGAYEYSSGMEVESDLEDFLARACEPFDCYIQRTAAYVRWRLSHPENEYVQVYLRNPAGELRGWAALRLKEHSGRRRAHIGDLWTDPKEKRAFGALLAAVALEARKRAMDEVYAISRAARPRSDFLLHGFMRRRSAMPVIAYAPSGLDLAQLDGWEFRDSDADMF